ncbi:flavin-containing amine oxidoreductase-domain containing protein [Aspergillus pseudonomiae]|uniref:Flavin-containing amine oxidoreductase-domain containing protein n=1 Tax=Aspergillus pseudonomiae TaxID=1506151 RepID=A0A5N7DNX8_9EURO|nr:flavin-containing amine oxidoreductase-domain containing protein [Aspergillus pseudonomiae]KAE8408170.1 flavin-containing amine oxidoreductase-domain containing protein [Aspergillus pseudonomiae]
MAPLASNMGAAASMKTHVLNGHSYEVTTLDQYIPTNISINSSGHVALLPSNQTLPRGSLQLNASMMKAHASKLDNDLNQATVTNLYSVSNSNSNPGHRVERTALGGVDSRSQSTDYLSQDVHTTPAHGRSSDSVTTSSFTPQPSQINPMPPITVISKPSLSSLVADTKNADSGNGFTSYRPRSSIPSRLPAAVYAQQCISAAYASRLNPYALHLKEQEALQDHLCHLHVTVYLNIRNGILRLWTRNPMVSVSKEEALGCAKDYRWMNLASFAYEWLVRNGYINFGCVEIPMPFVAPKKGRRKEGPVVVVIGAGMSGLGCARHLEGLFRHYRDASTAPRVILLEGRRRIGGRIYSHPLRSLQTSKLGPGLVPKAEMGAHIVVGFDRGNPLDPIIRSQLALPYHLLRDISTIYDIDGSPVDEIQDAMDERLYDDVLDRSGLYRHKSIVVPTAEGDRELIDSGRDLSTSDGVTVRQYEEARASGTIGLLLPTKRVRRGVGHKTTDIKAPGAPGADLARPEEQPAAFTCQVNGWRLNDGVPANATLNLDPVAKVSSSQTLGAVLDEGIRQYQRMLPLSPKDMRLINWHFANLEYANATNVSRLSLSGWDQDIGNEFEGEHSQVVGGYQQVPYGLFSLPTKLDVRTNKIVSKISYDPSGMGKQKTVVHCEDGESFAADKVVFTGSLGVLKHQSIQFEPPLPEWKRGAIDRLGFGVMNKVILVFDQPFWDTERDMFGLLREPTNRNSTIQEDYAANRGRFYLFWNCLKTTGLPVLIALMAGDAALQAECTPDDQIIAEVTSQLRNVFKHMVVPDPLETIVTRWKSDRFTRGSYSYVAAQALPGDYDLMAKPIGNLHFAGEATCGTHPATVHGAYISGLRAGSEVIESILGPIELPNPLVPEKGKAEFSIPTAAGQKRKEPPMPVASSISNLPTNSAESASPISAHQQAYEQAMWTSIQSEIGPPMPRPARTGLNPFLLYQKDYWGICRAQCDEARRAETNDPNAKAARDEIRHELGLMWRRASEEEKRPYIEQTEVNRQTNAEMWSRWKQQIAEWEQKAAELKTKWYAANPFASWGVRSADTTVPTNHLSIGAGASTSSISSLGQHTNSSSDRTHGVTAAATVHLPINGVQVNGSLHNSDLSNR